MPRLPLVVLLLSAAPAAAQPKFVVEKEVTDTVIGTATFDIRHPKLKATEWVLFATVAPSHDGQRAVKTTLTPSGTAVTDANEGRALLRARVPASERKHSNAISVSVSHEATLFRRTLRELKPDEVPPKVARLSPTERKQLVSATTHFDFDDPAVKKWVDALPRHDDPIAFARGVFDAIRTTAEYEYEPKASRVASAVCRGPKSDCGGLSSLFVAALRSKGIPARLLVGRWAQSADGKEKLGATVYYQWHVTAEFFADGVGWIPVDVSLAQSAKGEDAAKWHFGNTKGDFLTFHCGADLKVDTVHFGKELVPFAQGVAYWVKGDGTLDGEEKKETWTVKKK